MPQSTLALSYTDLKRHVARYMRYNPDNLSTAQATEVQDIIDRGYRQFLVPPIHHQWSFLRPKATLATADGTAEYALPDAFASLHGDITYAAEVSSHLIRPVSEELIRQKQQISDHEGKPEICAVFPVSPTGCIPIIAAEWYCSNASATWATHGLWSSCWT